MEVGIIYGWGGTLGSNPLSGTATCRPSHLLKSPCICASLCWWWEERGGRKSGREVMGGNVVGGRVMGAKRLWKECT